MFKWLTGPVFHVPGDWSGWNMAAIWLGRDEKPHPAAVLAQERYEQACARSFFLLVAGPVYAAFGLLVTNGWLYGIFAALLTIPLVKLVRPIARWWELRGTALTIALAARDYGADLDQYESAKARSRAGYGMFRRGGWTEERIKAAFVKLRPWAEKNCGRWA